MPIAELVRLAATLDGDWRSPLATRLAARWGRGDAVFVRSSATHVFVTDPGPDGGPRLVLRLRPEPDAGFAAAVERVATLPAGAPAVGYVPSEAGHLLEQADGYLAAAAPAVRGEQLDGDDLTPAQAHRWGALLAAFHAATGWNHGDPELDNVVWHGADGTFVDLDDAGPGDPAADVAFALRDWAGPAAAPDVTSGVPADFVAGYRTVRPLEDADLARMPAHAREAGARSLASVEEAVGRGPAPGWPTWALDLDRRLRDRAGELRAALG